MQGPPGTGKSQTITNIIAEMLAAGKHVLFVSQKMAALEVVQHRLNQAGLGAFCLQLHSHKRDKREVVQELIDSLDAPDVHAQARLSNGAVGTGRDAPSIECVREGAARAALCPASIGV